MNTTPVIRTTDSPFKDTFLSKVWKYTVVEGGRWYDVRTYGIPEAFHSVALRDGRRWDCVNGWTHGHEYDEDMCQGHVASATDNKICGRCGVHIDSLRPERNPIQDDIHRLEKN